MTASATPENYTTFTDVTEKFGGHEGYGRRRPSLKRIGARRVRGRISGKPLRSRKEFRQAPQPKTGRSVERRGLIRPH